MKTKVTALLLTFILTALVFFTTSAQSVPAIEPAEPMADGYEAPSTAAAPARPTQATALNDTGYEPVAELLVPAGSNMIARATAVSGNYAYMLTREDTLYTYDISGLSGGGSFTTLDSPVDTLALSNGNGLLRNGNILYAFGTSGIEVIDISNPADPAGIGAFDDMDVYNLIQHGGNLVAVGREKVIVYSLDDPSAPSEVNQHTLAAGVRVYSAAVSGNILYTGEYTSGEENSSGLRLYNFTSLSPLDFISRPATPYHLRVVDGQLVECATTSLALWDLSSPAAPDELYSLSGRGRVCAANGSDVVSNGAVHTPAGGVLASVATFETNLAQADGFPYGSAVGSDYVFLAQSGAGESRVLVLAKPEPADFVSTYAATAPAINGSIGFGEWNISNQFAFEHGFVTILNDRTRLYVLLDVLDDTSRDDKGDYYYLSFDVNKDGQITENVDLNYGPLSNSNMRYQYYLGPGEWTFLQPDTRSSRGVGFGCFFADGSLSFSFPFNITCSSHRVWEFGMDLAEIGAEAGGKVRMGFRVSSSQPSFTENVPAALTTDFSDFLEIELATPPDLLPAPSSNATVTLQQDAVEITQAVQDRQNSLPLVQSKDTAARLYVDVNGVITSQPTVAYLYGSRGGIDLPGSPLAQFHMAPSVIDREELDDTANFALPRSWTQSNVDFRGRALDFFGNEVTSSPFQLSFIGKEVPTYWVVPVNHGSADFPNVADDDDITEQESYLEAVFPVADVNFVRRPWQDLGANIAVGDTIDELNDYHGTVVLAWILSVIFNGEAPYELPDQIYGFTNAGGGLSDPVWAGGNGYVARGFWGTSREGTMAHEINHNLDRNAIGTWGRHVSDPATTVGPGGQIIPVNNPNWGCGAGGPDANWPFNNDDDINEVGFDTRQPWVDGSGNRDTVIPDNFPDFMSYCQSDDLAGTAFGQMPTKWISPYRWQNLFNYFDTSANARMLAQTGIITDVYYISGQLHRDGSGSLDPILVQPGIPSDIAPGDDYTIEVLDGSGVVLSSTPFFVTFTNVEGEQVDTVSFSYQIPVEDGAAKIVLKLDGEVLDEIAASDNVPTVNVTAPTASDNWDGVQTVQWQASDADGDDLTFTLLYSHDDGQSWFPVASGIEGNSYEVDTTMLPGSNSAKFRVVATDGFNTVEDDSATFTLAAKGPNATILTPTNNALFAADQSIDFVGEASDAEDGSLSGNSLVWLVDGEPFDTGQEVSAVLTPGFHEITLVAADADNNEGQDSITIIVGGGILHLPFVVSGN